MGDLELEFEIVRGISPLIQIPVEPVGKVFHEYESFMKHRVHRVAVSDSDNSDDSKSSSTNEIPIEIDVKFLKSLDHRDWKKHDHYKVLGLHRYRCDATDKDIKRAYQQFMLHHHPDKKKKADPKAPKEDNSFLTNFMKSYEILKDPVRRRAYDSVDPEFDDDVPGEKSANKNNFFAVFGPVFQRNARWSKDKGVPLLGDKNSTREEVEYFYEFWYTFDSWRDYSYEDEDKNQGEDKEERWYIDKQNKAERLVKKKEENSRIRKLVDNAYYSDPRIKKFRNEERDKKLAIKKAKQEEKMKQKQKEIEEQNRIEEEERKRKETEEQELKEKAAREKKEKEALKKEHRKERKAWQELSKEEDYFVVEERDRVQAMMDVDLLSEGLELLTLRDLVQEVVKCRSDKGEARRVIKEKVEDLKCGRVANLLLETVGGVTVPAPRQSSTPKPQPTPSKAEEKAWSPEEIQLLIKTVNLFPAGTTKRWEVVATYLHQHGNNTPLRPAKEVLAKAKQLQSTDATVLKEVAKDTMSQVMGVEKKMAKLESKSGSSVNATPSQRYEGAGDKAPEPWSKEEQSRLEQALKTYGPSESDRWDKIAEAIPNRSKKECMRRYKELVEMIKAKKAAMQAVGVAK